MHRSHRHRLVFGLVRSLSLMTSTQFISCVAPASRESLLSSLFTSALYIYSAAIESRSRLFHAADPIEIGPSICTQSRPSISNPQVLTPVPFPSFVSHPASGPAFSAVCLLFSGALGPFVSAELGGSFIPLIQSKVLSVCLSSLIASGSSREYVDRYLNLSAAVTIFSFYADYPPPT